MKNRILVFVFFTVALSFSFSNKKYKKFKTPEKFVYIPSGTTSTDEVSEYSCNAFYMLEHEVTNFEYRSFLSDLKSEGKMEDYHNAYPDSTACSTAWLKIGGFLEPMAQYYFSHPAYDNYPVVNISKEGAELFCNYLTEYYRELYGESVNDFRLPTKEEWIYAAKGGSSGFIYPWGGNGLRNESGCYLANFRTIGDRNIMKSDNGYLVVPDSLTVNQWGEDGGYFMVNVDSYTPNHFGLYNMSGNVAELVSNKSVAMGGSWNSAGFDIRVTSEEKFETASPFVGFRPVMSFLK